MSLTSALPSADMPRSMVWLFATASGLSVANVYYAQPLLDALANDFGISHAAVGGVVTATQIGCALALLLVVPLGDKVDRRRLMAVQLIALVVALVSVSMAAINSLIRQVSLRADYDFLTHVYSRSGLYEALKHEETYRHTRFLTVMLLDIDYFKSINDNYGHECGDRVLASFARQVQQVVGEDGMVARMGGEEFAVVVNSGDAQHGFELAERIRVTIANHPFIWRQQTLFLTVSIGLGSGKSEFWQLTEVFNRLMAEADDYLYRSKKAGRNCTRARLPDEQIVVTTETET